MSSQITKADLIEYIANLLNIDISVNLIYLDISEELENIKDLGLFRKELKARVANLNDDYKYLNGFQKFTKIVEDYNKILLVPTPREHDLINTFCDNLFNKLTWYFCELQWLKPTKQQLEKQIWKNHEYQGADIVNEKESKVCDLIGDTFEIYRLSTQNKPLLQSRIKEIVCGLNKERKVKALGFKTSAPKLLK